MNVRTLYILLLSAAALFLLSCGGKEGRTTGGIAVTDRLGREVVVPKKVDRIIGLRAGTLRLLVYMDAASQVVGVEEPEKRSERPYLAAHPELKDLPSCGPLMGGDAERIASLRPDVIFTAYSTAAEADDLQRKTGIPVIALECPELGNEEREGLFASFRLIGKVMGREARADSLTDYINSNILELMRRTDSIPARPAAYVGGVSYGGTKGIASTQPYFPPFVFTQTPNIASALEKRLISHVKGTYIDKEQLLSWNPDVIFIDEAGLDPVRRELSPYGVLFPYLKAAGNHKIFTLLPYNNYAVNYESVLLNAWYVGKTLYPDAFTDVDIREKGGEIVQMFFGRPVSDRLLTPASLRPFTQEDQP